MILPQYVFKSILDAFGDAYEYLRPLCIECRKSGGEFDSERDLQDYLRHYQDLRDEWKRKRQESTDITDDVVFEIELIRQIEINIDYILMQPSSPLKKLLSG